MEAENSKKENPCFQEDLAIIGVLQKVLDPDFWNSVRFLWHPPLWSWVNGWTINGWTINEQEFVG